MRSAKQLPSLFILVLLISVCLGAASDVTSFPMPISNDTVSISDKDNGRTINLKKDSLLIIKLESQLGTGYGWKVVKNNSDRLEPLGEPDVEKDENQKLGGTERQIFRFKAKSAGSSTLELHYARPWEKTAPPSKSFRVTVRVS
jgi:predicted secreted protein